MSLNHYLAETKKGLRYPVYILYGDSHFLLKEAIFITYSIIPEGDREFFLEIFDMEDDSPSMDDIVDILNTMTFLGGKRFVIIENTQSMKKKDQSVISDYISKPSPYSVLIMLHLGKLSPQKIKDFFGKANLQSQNIKVIPIDIRPQDMPLWIKERGLQKGINLTDGAIDYLMGITGQDIGLISSELEKIALLGKRQIDSNDISSIIKSEGDYDAFDLIEAMKRNDKKGVFRILKKLADSTEPYNILGALNWYLSRLREEDRIKDPERVYSLLYEADSAIKVSGGRYPLEYLFIRLLQP